MLNRHGEQGSALLLTIIITMVLLVLGGALGVFSLMERGQVGREEADLKAYYLARSGADLMAQVLIENPEKFDIIEGKTSDQVEFQEGYFTVKVDDLPSGVRVASTGVVGNRKRTVSIVLDRKNVIPGFDQVVYSKTDIVINAGADIEGDIATSSTDVPAVSLIGGVSVKPKYEDGVQVQPGDVYIPTTVYENSLEEAVYLDNDSCTISGEIKPKDIPDYGKVEIKEPPVSFGSSNNEYYISTSGGTETRVLTLENDIQHYKKFGVEGPHKTLVIDLGEQERTLVIDRFVQTSSRIILKNVGEKGHLHLFVREMVCSNGADLNYTTDDEHPGRDALTLYYFGGDPKDSVPFGGVSGDDGWYFRFAGNIVTDQAEVYISSSAAFRGNIFTNTTNLAMGGAGKHDTGLVYAPNAHVIIGNGASAQSTVANSFLADGGAVIKFGEVDPDTFPDGVIKPVDGFWNYERSHWERY